MKPPERPPEPSRGPDHEFGVPFPGTVLPRDRWTNPRLVLPRTEAAAPFDWERVFGRSGPRVIDLGCGNGRFLIGSALARPGHDHLGIDLVPQSIAHAARRAGARGLANVRFAQGDAIRFALGRLAPDSIDEVHIYHPQPYYDPEKRANRMLTPELVGTVFRALRPGGFFVLQTDNPYYWKHILTTVPVLFDWRVHDGPWPDAPAGRTRREILARDRGLRVYRGTGVPRKQLPAAEVEAVLNRLPQPDFDANRPRFRAGRKRTG